MTSFKSNLLNPQFETHSSENIGINVIGNDAQEQN